MKQKILFPASILIFTILLICAGCGIKQSIYIDEEKSYFSDFSVVDDEVQIVYHITICNEYDTEKTVWIKGDFADEVENGLLAEGVLYAVDSEKSRCAYPFQPHEEKNVYVTFIGTFAGNEHMKDRLLPPISIEEVSQECK